MANNKMEHSHGDKQWIGDGIYLYRDKMLVFRWVVIKYIERHDVSQIRDELLQKYMILKVEIKYEYERVFSLLNPVHKIEFERIKKYCLSNVESFKKLKATDIVDGAVINHMFNNMGYREEFDIVEAFFVLKIDNKLPASSFKSLGEYQFCIKNEDNILGIEDATHEFSYEEMNKKLLEFNRYRTNFNDGNNSYSKKNRGGNYGKKSF